MTGTARTTKLYCYVDETGQDTKGAFFLVVVVILDEQANQQLTHKLLEVERHVGKRRARWSKNRLPVRIAFLQRLLTLSELEQSIFYSSFRDTKAYTSLTAETLIKALQRKDQDAYWATIEIDGCNQAELRRIRKLLKAAKVRYHRLRGPRDESVVFIRLADAMAGFLRDFHEGQPYTQTLLPAFEQRELIHKIE